MAISATTGRLIGLNDTNAEISTLDAGDVRLECRDVPHELAAAGDIEARRFDVKSELSASFWYDASGRWVKCAFTAQGSKVEYVLRELPS